MRRQSINIYTYNSTVESVVDIDRWKYLRKNWFTDKMWQLLMRWGCLVNPVDTTVKYERVTIDITSVSKAVDKCLEGIYNRRLRPTHIYMGPEEFEKHLTEPLAKDFFLHNIDFKIPLYDGGYRIFDIPVTVVPHMEGILVV